MGFISERSRDYIRLRKFVPGFGPVKCVRCRKTINKGDYVIGNKTAKFCRHCAELFLHEGVREMTNFIKQMRYRLQDLEENRDKYDKEETLNAL